MHVLQINNNHRIVGGSDSVFFNTTRLLREGGHRVTPFTSAHPEDSTSGYAPYFPPGLDGQSARPWHIVRYLHNHRAAQSLDRLIRDHGPFDIAHLHIYHGRLTASILPILRKHGIPTIQSQHEYRLACPIYTLERNGSTCDLCVTGTTLNALRHRCKQGSLTKSAVALAEYWTSRAQGDRRLIDHFLCVSTFQRKLLERAGVPRHKLSTLHNFIDPALYPPARPSTRDDYLLYFGRLESLKGIGTLASAAAALSVRLLVAGAGPLSEQLENLARTAPNINILGFQSGAELQSLIAHALAVAVPSEWYENCPMSVLEAKAAGTPVIGARIGGIPELIRDGVDGFLFQPGSQQDLQACIQRIQAADADAMGAAGRQDVADRFSPKTHLSQLVKLYSSIIQQARPGNAG